MPFERTISRGKMTYMVVYQDDSPERAQAVQRFQSGAELNPSLHLPDEIDGMSVDEANAHLRAHPIVKPWKSLTIGVDSPLVDDDLALLRHVPELQRVRIDSPQITDAGIHHLRNLGGLQTLHLYSPSVTDACLADIRALRSLTSLDVQSAAGLSRAAVLAAAAAMPWLTSVYAPEGPSVRAPT